MAQPDHEMTQEQKRIAIAEVCGWKFHPPTEHLYSKQEKADAIMCWVRPGNDPWLMERVPDYFNDLNACHEMEEVLNAGQINAYLGKLYENTKPAKVGSIPWEIICARVAVHATAAERAEAFGRALNLW
jgi:hypothetical protein